MKDILMSVRDRAVQLGADFADVRLVSDDRTHMSRQDGQTDRMSSGTSMGLGVRILHKGSWGFASTSIVDKETARSCLDDAIAAARLAPPATGIELATLPAHEASAATAVAIDPRSISAEDKMALLRTQEAEMLRVAGDKAVNTTVGLSNTITRTVVCNTQGALVEQEQTRVSFNCFLVCADGDVRQEGYESRARLAGWEEMAVITPEAYAVKAASKAVELLSARRAPAGVFPVILHPSVVGVFIHEAFGHNAEADLVLAGESILEGKMGTKIASDLVTVIDDGTIPGQWGSFAFDHEGTPSQRRRIIDKGTLVGFMHSLESAGRMDVPPNGSARADGFAQRPIVRMSNTLVEAGETPFDEMVKGIGDGILFQDGRWGYVFCERGQYTLNVGSGRMIRNGELCEMVRDCCMCGMVLETLHRVDAVSCEWDLPTRGGGCGKNGQGMPVSFGGPYLRVADMVVGGQDA